MHYEHIRRAQWHRLGHDRVYCLQWQTGELLEYARFFVFCRF